MRAKQFLSKKNNFVWLGTAFWFVATNLFMFYPLWNAFNLKNVWFAGFMELVFLVASAAWAELMWHVVMRPMLDRSALQRDTDR